MFKKICVILGGLMVTIIAILTSNNQLYAEEIMSASSTKANVCSYGTVTGRIGDLQKGDNIRLGVKRDDGTDLGWILLANMHDKTWITMSSISAGITNASNISSTNWSSWRYENSLIKPFITRMNDRLIQLPMEKNMIEERSFTFNEGLSGSNLGDTTEKLIFVPTYLELFHAHSKSEYYNVFIHDDWAWDMNEKYDPNHETYDSLYLMSEPCDSNGWCAATADTTTLTTLAVNKRAYIRPAAKWNLDNIAFSVSNEDIQSGCVNKIENPEYDPEKGMLKITGNMMNIRFKDPSIKVKLDDIVAIKTNGTTGTSTRNFSMGDSFRLKYSGATIGTDKMISMLVSDINGDMVYYMQIDKAKAGSQYVDIDTSGWEKGTYQIQLANEILTDSNSPTYSSELTAPIEITINDDLSSLEVSLTPDAADASKNFFETTVNANSGSSIAKIKTKNGVAPIYFEILDGKETAAHKALFEIEKGANGLPKIQADGSVRIRAKQNLTPGVYYFRVQAYDANNKPSPAIYEDGGAVNETGITKGIISDNVKVIVYPTGSHIQLEEQLVDGKNFNVDDIQTKPSSVLGILSLDPAFNASGVSIKYSIKDVKVDGVASDDLEITSANAALGKITGKSNIIKGVHSFTAIVTFQEGGKEYTIELPNQKLTIAPSLYFTKTAADTTKITRLTMDFADIEADRIFTICAKGDDHIEYRLLSANEGDGVLDIVGAVDGTNTTGIFKMRKPGTTKVEAIVRENGRVISNAILLVEIVQGELPDFTYTLDGEDLVIPELVTTYAPNRHLQLGIKDAPIGSSVKWKIDADEDGMHNGIYIMDVISVEEDTGLVTILNANLRNQSDVKIIATLSAPGYAEKELDPILVTIEKAPQDTLKFAQPVYQMPSGAGSFTPRFKNGASSDTGDASNYILKCDDVRVRVSDDTYFYQVSDAQGAQITIKAINKGNRNYLQSDTITATLRILKPGESLPNVEVTPSKSITYGESVTLHIRDEDPNAIYRFTSLDENVLVQDSEDMHTFHSKGVSDSTMIQISKELDGFVESEDYVAIQVKPKPIEVELKQNYTIMAGESMPVFELKEFEPGDLLFGDVLPAPIIKASITDTSKAGTYPITLQYPKELDAYKYDIQLKKASLLILQNTIDALWIKAYQKEDPTKTRIDPNKWYAQDIVVELIDTSSGYDQIRRSKTGEWASSFIVSEEKAQSIDVYLRNSKTQAISDPISVSMKIDKTAPSVPVLTMEELHTNAIAYFLNQISFGNWMNKEIQVHMEAEDGLSGIAYYTYQEDDNEKTSVDGIVRYQGQTKLSLQAKACDAAGNCSAYSKAENIMIDTLPPSITGVKDKSVYKQYYIPRFVSVQDAGSGVKTAAYTKQNGKEVAMKEGVIEKIMGEGEYVIDACDHAGNEMHLSFTIIPLPNIETEIDGSDASKDIIDQIQKELDEARDQLTPEEIEDYEKWIEDAIKKWEDSRKKVIETEDKSAKIEGIGDTDFDPSIKLIVEKVKDADTIKLPRKAKVVYDVYLKKGNTIIQPNGEIKVYLPYTEEIEPIVYQIDEDGTITKIPVAQEKGFITFTTRRLMRYAISDVLQEEMTCKLEGVKINIDTDDDGFPDLNVDIDQDCSADLNIDMNEDRLPDLQIDTTGNGKADINIDVNMDGKADVNMTKIKEWKPELNASYEGFAYDTMENILPEVNIDVNGDGKPDFNIDKDGDGVADTNLINDASQDIRKEAIGGATTGESNTWTLWFLALLLSFSTLMYSVYKEKRKKRG